MTIRNHTASFPQTGQAGFTIIESLIAILVIAILLIGLSPVIVLSVATRVQARRVELGTQAARTYIDSVKSGIIGDITAGALYPLPTITNTPPSEVLPPTATGALNCPTDRAYCTTPVGMYCVAGNPGTPCTTSSVTDMIVQSYTYQPNPATPVPDPNQGYVLGVRVYRADAFKESGPLEAATPKLNQDNQSHRSQTFTGGLSDRKAPIVEMNTEISSSQTTYNNYCTRLGNKAGVCQ